METRKKADNQKEDLSKTSSNQSKTTSNVRSGADSSISKKTDNDKSHTKDLDMDNNNKNDKNKR